MCWAPGTCSADQLSAEVARNHWVMVWAEVAASSFVDQAAASSSAVAVVVVAFSSDPGPF